MTDNTALGDRMKRYEAASRFLMPKRTYSILRVDGRSFHTLTRGLQKPYDEALGRIMNRVAENLCREISGAKLAYTQSDEVSVLFTDFDSITSEPWFGGNLAKQISISAAIASNTFNDYISWIGKENILAQFDSRVFTIPDPIEVANYFVWRQRDCVRNSISMAAQSMFSHRSLQGLNSDQLKEKMWTEKEVNWENYYKGFTHGRICYKTAWNEWLVTEAPTFKAEPDSFLSDRIPPHTLDFWRQ